MPSKDKVQGGTKTSGDLCSTCKMATIREGRGGERWVQCSIFNRMIPNQTLECTAHVHKNNPDLYDMQKIAWIVTGDPKGKIGFKKYSTMDKDERREVDVW